MSQSSVVEDPREQYHVLVVCFPYQLSLPFNGFVDRHVRMVTILASEFDVTVLYLCESRSPEVPSQLPAGVTTQFEVQMPRLASSRKMRLKEAWRHVRGVESAADQVIIAAAAEAHPDVVVAVGPEGLGEYRSLYRRYPSLYLFEEDIEATIDHPLSLRARYFRRLIDWLYSHANDQPEVVGSISEREVPAARKIYPRSQHRVIPHTLPQEDWPRFDEPSDGDWAIVVGDLTKKRNSEMLVGMLAEIERRGGVAGLKIRLISGPGIDQSLVPYLEMPWVEWLLASGSLVDLYRQAWVALVPAARVTGVKTTILQAWACACPVLSSEPAANSVDGRDAILVGRTAVEMVDALVALLGAPEIRFRLVRAGLNALLTRFNPDNEAEIIRRLVDDLGRRPRNFGLMND